MSIEAGLVWALRSRGTGPRAPPAVGENPRIIRGESSCADPLYVSIGDSLAAVGRGDERRAYTAMVDADDSASRTVTPAGNTVSMR